MYFGQAPLNIDSLAREAVQKSDPNGSAVIEVVNLFRLIPSQSDRNAVLSAALKLLPLARHTIRNPQQDGLMDSLEASLNRAAVLTPATVTAPRPTAATFKPNKKALLFFTGVFAVMAVGAWGVGKYFERKTHRYAED